MKKKLILILFCVPFFSNNTLSSSLKNKENDKENKIKSLVNKICGNTLDATLTATVSMLSFGHCLHDMLHQQPSYCTNQHLLQAIECANSMFPHSVKLNGCEVINSTIILLRFGISTLAAIRACYVVYDIKEARNKLINLTRNDKIN